MKKYLFLIAVGALTFSACSNDTVLEESTAQTPQPKEIAFSPLAQPTTRAAVDGTVFPTTSAMQVAAYDVTNSRNFFTHTTFSHSGSGTIWKGGKYWPLSAAQINFLAYTNFQGTDGSETTGATWASAEASQVTLVMTDNKTAQKDLMYAIGYGAVTQTGNTLSFPENVPMVFKHAQAWISFYADTEDAASGGIVTLNSITLNGAKYSGTYTITHTNYTATTGQSVAGAWSSSSSPTADVVVPNWNGVSNGAGGTTKVIPYDGSANGAVVGDGLLIVPDDDPATGDFSSFTINYTLDGNTYNYTYTPASTNVDQAKHYIYNICFSIHEIKISATVTDWVDQTAVVSIQ